MKNTNELLNNPQHDAMSRPQKFVNPQNPSKETRTEKSIEQDDQKHLVERLGQHLVQFISQQIKPQDAQAEMAFQKSVLNYLDALFKGLVIENKETKEKSYSLHHVLENQKQLHAKFNAIASQIQMLQQTIEKQCKTIEEQASIIRKQHETIAKYENDVIYKTQKDLIMEMIGIADQLQYTLQDHAQNKDFDALYQNINDLSDWVKGSLQIVAVRPSIQQESKELDKKRQEVIEIQETAKPEEDGMIKSVLPGYIWSVPMVGSNEMKQADDSPKLYEFMIRPEQVIMLKYRKRQNEISGNPTAQKEDSPQVENPPAEESNETEDNPTKKSGFLGMLFGSNSSSDSKNPDKSSPQEQ